MFNSNQNFFFFFNCFMVNVHLVTLCWQKCSSLISYILNMRKESCFEQYFTGSTKFKKKNEVFQKSLFRITVFIRLRRFAQKVIWFTLDCFVTWTALKENWLFIMPSAFTTSILLYLGIEKGFLALVLFCWKSLTSEYKIFSTQRWRQPCY